MSGGPIEFDMVLDLCRTRHRRVVLAVLTEQRRPLTLDALAEEIVEHNHQTSLEEVSEETLRRIHLSLIHEYVPKLETLAVVEYDPDRKLVKPTARFDQLQPHVSAIVDADPDLETPLGS